MCHAWRAATYECIHGQNPTCCFTCGQTINKCPTGQVLRDENTCTDPKDCPCILQNGNILAVSDKATWFKKISGIIKIIKYFSPETTGIVAPHVLDIIVGITNLKKASYKIAPLKKKQSK